MSLSLSEPKSFSILLSSPALLRGRRRAQLGEGPAASQGQPITAHLNILLSIATKYCYSDKNVFERACVRKGNFFLPPLGDLWMYSKGEYGLINFSFLSAAGCNLGQVHSSTSVFLPVTYRQKLILSSELNHFINTMLKNVPITKMRHICITSIIKHGQY